MEWTVEIVFPFHIEFQLPEMLQDCCKESIFKCHFYLFGGCIYCPESSFPGCVLPESQPCEAGICLEGKGLSPRAECSRWAPGVYLGVGWGRGQGWPWCFPTSASFVEKGLSSGWLVPEVQTGLSWG